MSLTIKTTKKVNDQKPDLVNESDSITVEPFFYIEELKEELDDCAKFSEFMRAMILSVGENDDGWIIENHCKSLSFCFQHLSDSLADLYMGLNNIQKHLPK